MGNDWFFLSYAKLDLELDPIRSIHQLYVDVDNEIRRKKVIKEGQAGFFDENSIQQGDQWPTALSQALISCRVLVCIYSSAYFASEYCGKEWALFSSRLEPMVSKELPILPILLDPPSDLPLPEVLADIQYKDGAYPQIYRENGLRYLLNRKNEELSNAYQNLVDVLVERIIQRATKNLARPLESIPDIKSIKNQFARVVRYSSIQPRSPFEGPRYSDFVYVAAKREEIQSLGRSVINYGDDGEVDWKPYLPGFNLNKEISLIAQEVATREGFRYQHFKLDGSLIQVLQEAQKRNEIVIIIIDTWTLKISSYRELIAKYDQINLWNCGALVTWNLEDSDTRKNERQLKNTVQIVFVNKVRFGHPQLVNHAGPPKAFARQLSILLQKLRSQIIETSQVLKADTEDGEIQPLPTVQAPGGTT